jgi:hypothetical protein
VGREYIISSKCLPPYGILLADLTITGIAKHFLTNCERCGRHRAFNFHQFMISLAPVLKGIFITNSQKVGGEID